MAIIYRTSGAWGSGQGSNLAPAQVDGNFWYVAQQITQIESDLSGGAVVSISTISMTGNQMTIVLTNGAHFVFTVPMGQFNPRGNWAPSTTYAVNDLVLANGDLYMVIFSHVSGTTFDPAANDGAGHDYYALLIPGVTSQWPIVADLPTEFYTPVIHDAGLYIRCSNPHGTFITVPGDATTAFAINTEINFHQAAGPVSFSADLVGPVTLNVPSGFLASTDRLHATATLKKVASNEWDLFGLLSQIGSP